jgi:hypothetical protein
MFSGSQATLNQSQQATSQAQGLSLVSVIIPTWNRSEMVVEAVRSVQQQSWPNVQIIVVDDGSTDDTEERFANPIAWDGVLYLRQEHQGQAVARNEGLRHAQGSYIATLDSDDLWKPNFLEECIRVLKIYHLDFVFANWTLQGVDGTPSPGYLEAKVEWKDYPLMGDADWRYLSPEQSRELFLKMCPAPSSALLFRRELIAGGWNEQLLIADDWCFQIQAVLSRPCRVAFTMQKLWTKRNDGSGIYDGRSAIARLKDVWLHDEELIVQHFNSLLTQQEKKIFTLRHTQHSFWLGLLTCKIPGQRLRGLRLLFSSFLRHPNEFLKVGLQFFVRYCLYKLGLINQA